MFIKAFAASHLIQEGLSSKSPFYPSWINFQNEVFYLVILIRKNLLFMPRTK